MKNNIILTVLFTFVPNIVFGACDWSTIKPMVNGDYEYSTECHILVGKMVQDAKVKDTQVQDLSKAIELKDLALSKADERVMLWRNISQDEQDRLQKMNSMTKTDNFLYFGLGVLSALGAGFMAARLIKP